MGVLITFGPATKFWVSKAHPAQHPDLPLGWRTDWENIPQTSPSWMPQSMHQSERFLVLLKKEDPHAHELAYVVAVAWFVTANGMIWVTDDGTGIVPDEGFSDGQEYASDDYMKGSLFAFDEPLVAWMPLEINLQTLE